MTKLLAKAFDELSKLPTRDQNTLARDLLRECEGRRAQRAKPASRKTGRAAVDGPVPPKLAKLLKELEQDRRAGRLIDAGWDEL